MLVHVLIRPTFVFCASYVTVRVESINKKCQMSNMNYEKDKLTYIEVPLTENCIMRTTSAPLDGGLSIGLCYPLFENLGLTIISLIHTI